MPSPYGICSSVFCTHTLWAEWTVTGWNKMHNCLFPPTYPFSFWENIKPDTYWSWKKSGCSQFGLYLFSKCFRPDFSILTHQQINLTVISELPSWIFCLHHERPSANPPPSLRVLLHTTRLISLHLACQHVHSLIPSHSPNTKSP